MELNEFITATITSIIKGVNDAKETANENGIILNPYSLSMSDSSVITYHKTKTEGARQLHTIDFDIAVTSSSKSETSAGAGINVVSINFGGKVAETDDNQMVSRIKFNLKMTLPSTEY